MDDNPGWLSGHSAKVIVPLEGMEFDSPVIRMKLNLLFEGLYRQSRRQKGLEAGRARANKLSSSELNPDQIDELAWEEEDAEKLLKDPPSNPMDSAKILISFIKMNGLPYNRWSKYVGDMLEIILDSRVATKMFEKHFETAVKDYYGDKLIIFGGMDDKTYGILYKHFPWINNLRK